MLVFGYTLKYFLIHEKIENWDFFNVALDWIFNFPQFMKEMENWDFCLLA